MNPLQKLLPNLINWCCGDSNKTMVSSNVDRISAEEYLRRLSNDLVRESSLPDDKYHLGKMILKVFKKYPNRILQIDKQTGESETIQSFHRRSLRAALRMRARGLRTGDVVGVLGPNHLDLAVPFIACLYDGLAACPIDRTWRHAELDASLQITRPKIIFCQNARADDIHKVITANDIDCEIVTFDDNNSGYETIHEFLQSVKDDAEINNFKPADFDTSHTTAVMLSTSGSTGLSKNACIAHQAFVHQIGLFLTIFPYVSDDMSCLLLSPLQWASGALMQLSSCLFAFTRIGISADEFTMRQVMEMIHDFKPKWGLFSPNLALMLLRDPERRNYDYTSLRALVVGGGDATVDLIRDLENMTKGAVYNAYGMTETCGATFSIIDHSVGSCGSPAPGYEYKIVDVDSGAENGPNMPGELWIKGPTLFKGYYGKPEATKEAFSEDGFFKTGDLFCKDENNNYIFVDRIKMMLKFKMHQISPVEIENVIKQHPGVKDVGVTGVEHPYYGDLPVACIVRTAPGSVDEEEIHELIRTNLAPSKYLRGGILFVDQMKMTPTFKIDRKGLKVFASQTIDVSTLKIQA